MRYVVGSMIVAVLSGNVGCAELAGLTWFFAGQTGGVICVDGYMGYRVTATVVDADDGTPLADVPFHIQHTQVPWIATGTTDSLGVLNASLGQMTGGCFIRWLPTPQLDYGDIPETGEFIVVLYPDTPECGHEFVFDMAASDVVVTKAQENVLHTVEFTTPLAIDQCATDEQAE